MSYIGNTVENQNYVPAVDYFNGDGSTVAFTLSRPVASVAAVQAVISNVPQNPGSAFTVSGSTITFTSAPPSGTANIYVYYTSPNTQVVQPGQGTVYPSSLSTGGPYWDTSGNVGIGTSSPDAKLTLKNPSATGEQTVFDVLGATNTTKLLYASVNQTTDVNNFGTGYGAPLAFVTNSTERMRINAGAPILCLSGGNTSATGTGIAFPATQSASSDANTLDDYEEGTFTPTLVASGYTFTQATKLGAYTKIGNIVFFKLYMTAVYASGSGTVEGVISGLPFSANANAVNYGGCSWYPDNGSAFFSRVGVTRTKPSSNELSIGNGWNGVAIVQTFNWATIPAPNMEFEISGHYFVN